MIRVHVICEGQTEEAFVKNLLQKEFLQKNIDLRPTLIGKPGHKGGNVNFNRLFVDVKKILLGDNAAYCTTFIDYYGLPSDFPGKPEAEKKTSGIAPKARAVTDALTREFGKILPNNARRFIPYIQMHEFEALLFSDPAAFARGIERQDITEQFREIRKSFNTPEMINDSRNTAPSMRVKELVDGYEKPIMGSLAISLCRTTSTDSARQAIIFEYAQDN